MMNSQYSILIPTWNNFEYLKLCIDSLNRNSAFKHQILVFVNEGKDGSIKFLLEKNIEFIHSETNVGICYAMNALATKAKNHFLVYMNDDMVALPGWDISFKNAIMSYNHDKFFLSSSLIEPQATTNKNYPIIIADFGDEPNNFNEKALVENVEKLKKNDWSGASWPVSLVAKHIWEKVGGYSIEFSPGMYSDPDFSMKLWKYGIREFRGLGECLFYHFGSKSTNRLRKSTGSKVFLHKWGISAKLFYQSYLHMGEPYAGKLLEASLTNLQKLRYVIKRKLT